MFKKGISLLQKMRNIPGKVKVLSTIAVFSPTFVACYGMPMDENCSSTRDGYDCIDGYIMMCNQMVGNVDYNADPHICASDESGNYRQAQCTKEGLVFTDRSCSMDDRYSLIYPPGSDEP